MNKQPLSHPVALVTGVSRKIGIGASIAAALAQSGWNIAMTYWRPYDRIMPWGSHPEEVQTIQEYMTRAGSQVYAIEADLSDTKSPSLIFDTVEKELGTVTALILCHCHSVDSDIINTSIESFDLHFAVNARASWLLVREFGKRFHSTFGSGRIIGITSDHTVGNLPYGASKGALDRIVLAAAREFQAKGITANIINPGATDTGWMTQAQLETERRNNPLGRVGLPQDCANLVKFLCSDEGGWINAQVLYSNGGIK